MYESFTVFRVVLSKNEIIIVKQIREMESTVKLDACTIKSKVNVLVFSLPQTKEDQLDLTSC